MKTFTTIAFGLALLSQSIAQPYRVNDKMLVPGEELRYKVKWNFLRLGTIIMRAEKISSSDDSTLFKLSMTIESNPDLAIIKIREYSESVVSAMNMMSKDYQGLYDEPTDRSETQYRYDESSRRVFCSSREVGSGKLLLADTLVDVPPYVDGPSMFFYARWMSRSIQAVRVPKIADAKMGYIDFDFTLGREYVEIGALDQPVRTRKYKGVISGGGGTSAGLSGEFTGWVTDDEAAVPVRAEMKVILGSIHIELEQWTRTGWNPPVYVELVKN